jgi:hypothetical protein
MPFGFNHKIQIFLRSENPAGGNNWGKDLPEGANHRERTRGKTNKSPGRRFGRGIVF